MAGKGRGIRAGGAYIELSLLDSPLSRGLASAQAKMQRFGASIRSVGIQLGAIGSAVTAPLAIAAKKYADFGSNIYDMSKRTGMSTEALSTLGYAAEQSGGSIQGLEKAIRSMQKLTHDAATGSKSAAESLRELNLSAADLSGLNTEQTFDKLLSALAGIDDEGKRAAVAMDIFGARSGTALLPMLDGGVEGLQSLRAEFRRLGGELSAMDAKKADELGDAIGKLVAGLAVMRNEVGKSLAPILTQIANKLADSTRIVSLFVENNAQLVVGLGAVGVAMTALSGVALSLSAAVTAVGAAFGALSVIATPLGGFAAALTTWIALTTDWKKAIEGVKEAMSGITDAIKVGNFALAGRMAGAAFRIGYLSAVKTKFEDFSEWLDIVNARLAGNWGRPGKSGAGSLLGNWAAGMGDEIEHLMDQLKQASQDANFQKGMADQAREHGQAVDKWVTGAWNKAAEAIAKFQKKMNAELGSPFFDVGKTYGSKISDVFFGALKNMRSGWMELNKWTEQHIELLDQAKQVWQDTRTPQERYKLEIANLQKLLEKGLIAEDVFDRAANKAKKDMQESLLAEIDVADITSSAMFGGNRAAQVYAAETFQRQAIAIAKQQVDELKDVNTNLRELKGAGLAFQ